MNITNFDKPPALKIENIMMTNTLKLTPIAKTYISLIALSTTAGELFGRYNQWSGKTSDIKVLVPRP